MVSSWALKWSCLPLSPIVSGCLPSCGGSWCWLVWSASWALKWSCLPLSPVVSLHVGGTVLVGVVGFLGSEVVLSPVVSHVRLSPFMWGGCWLVWSASWALKWSCLPLSPIVSGCLPSCGGWVLVGVVGFLGSEVVLSPVVSRCFPSCGGWVLVGVVGFLGSEVVLSPVVSHCLRLSPFMWGVGVGWCGRHLAL